MILDAPTSALDARSELETFERFHRLSRDRTVILVSHRFSTVRMADRIFVLDEGRLVEEGSHDALVARGGPYAAMCRIREETFQMNRPPVLPDIPLPSTEAPIDH